METHTKLLESALAEYKAKLEATERELNKLRIENNNFRLMLLTSAAEPDPIFLSNQKAAWSELPAEILMQFLELHEAHAKIYSELIHAKLSKHDIGEYLKKRNKDKLDEAKKYRENKNLTVNERVERRIVTKEQASQEKAVKALAKTLGKTYDEARLILEQTMNNFKK